MVLKLATLKIACTEAVLTLGSVVVGLDLFREVLRAATSRSVFALVSEAPVAARLRFLSGIVLPDSKWFLCVEKVQQLKKGWDQR